MDPAKRVVAIVAATKMFWDEALQAARDNDFSKMARKILTAFEMLDPLVRSIAMLDEAQANALKDFLKPRDN